MQQVIPIMRRLPVVLVALLLGMVAVACGAADSSGGSTATVSSPLAFSKPPKGSMEACVIAAGAKRALNGSQLAFLRQAEAADEVDKPGLVFDKVTKTVVRLWETKASEARAPEWAIWFGQPFEEDREPLDIVNEDPPKAFVAFIRQPTKKQWHRASRCPA